MVNNINTKHLKEELGTVKNINVYLYYEILVPLLTTMKRHMFTATETGVGM